MSILIFLGVLFALVLVHELGHFAVAKWTGMRVDEFGIGFPPKIFGIKRGGTEYTFNLFPIGGFVKIRGEDGVFTGEQSADNESFTSKSKWAQSAVLVAGVTMNILFAWVLVAIAFGIGVKTAVSESDATSNASLVITNVLEGSPAGEALLTPGTVINEVSAGGDSLEVLTPSSFSNFIATHSTEPVTLIHTVGDELRVLQLTPVTGIIDGKTERPAIGVALSLIDTVPRSVGDALTQSGMYVLTSLRDITVGIVKLVTDALLMRADLSQVAGPVGIVGLVGEASAFGLTSLLMFTAFISLNLAVINIFPFPALDGGRLLFVGIEALKGTPIRPHYAQIMNTVGFLLLIILMIVVTWNDIARL